MSSFRVVSCLAAVVMTLPLQVAFAAQDLPPAERGKIEKLIEHVQGLKSAVFVRNDVEYDASAAARFLRGKWEANAKDIRTTKDFIDKAASVSTTTGKPYLIRLRMGTEMKELKSGEYLLEQLKMLEQKAQP